MRQKPTQHWGFCKKTRDLAIFAFRQVETNAAGIPWIKDVEEETTKALAEVRWRFPRAEDNKGATARAL
jgi:hypothetical protein